MSDQTATIRELRTDFRSVKRKIEQHGRIVITDHGEPLFLLQPLPQEVRRVSPLPDYLARLKRRQPKALSAEETRSLWEEERRD
jgi:antitoxin (DNA-binding transcriptional repressor) of toxin-antitoxin stability system